MLTKKNQYINVLEKIMTEILKSQKNSQIVRKNIVLLYWHIGKILLEYSEYNSKFITNLSADLSSLFFNMKGLTPWNLKKMRKFAKNYPDYEFVKNYCAKITWSNNILIIDKVDSFEKRKWYIEQTIQCSWSFNLLNKQINSDLYNRQVTSKKVTNFKNTLPAIQSDLATQTLKDPYCFDFISSNGKVKELEIEEKMLDKIKDVLTELGHGFAFIGDQYKLTIGDKDYFIDLLFYNVHLKCYIVIELKAREFHPSDVGKLNFYLSAVNDLVKNETDNPSIGLLLCKKKDKFTAKYAIKDINNPIAVSEYRLLEDTPQNLQSLLPKLEDIQLHFSDLE